MGRDDLLDHLVGARGQRGGTSAPSDLASNFYPAEIGVTGRLGLRIYSGKFEGEPP
jgi:hypothetical protein